MNWAKGFSASYYASFIDVHTWRDVSRFEITDGTINVSDSQLVNSADITAINYTGSENWIRVWLDAKQGDDSEHVPVFTGLATSPSQEINGVLTTNKLECYSVLKPAADILLQRGWYAPAGFNGGEMIANLLGCIPAPVYIAQNAPVLTQSIIAEDGETNLSMVHKILVAINWRIRIDGYGNVQILPKALNASVRYSADNNDVIEPHLIVDSDWFNCPNVFRAVADDVSAVARDDSPDSEFSTIRRGREIWQEEINCDLADMESIADYAYRMLKENQQKAVTIQYDRRYNPDITVGDIVSLHYPKQGIEGDYRITSQTIGLSYGAKTSDEVILA